MLFARADASQQRARELFHEMGADLDHVDVTIDLTSIRSHCAIYEDETIEVTIGLGVQFGSFFRGAVLDWFTVHEFAHAWWFTVEDRLSRRDCQKWVDLFGGVDEVSQVCVGWNPLGKYPPTEFVSWYATTSSHEDFAETTASLLMGNEAGNPVGLRRKKADFIEYLLNKY